ncbi:LysR family transcriptional regulator [Streptomyces roseoverticillatus]|uniref:LysR family transcriptional regulator n=1 Tax=Streptomyces roseoverticillatus TaxID=66429 RepID=UPI0033FF7AFB
MAQIDFNLLVALDALLEEGSVTGAAERLHTSPPAMSRTLARLRRTLQDPVLVRAGRGLVPTPRALELRAEVNAFVNQGRTLLAPHGTAAPGDLRATVAIQASDVLLTSFAAPLIARVRSQAPGMSLRFVPESHEGTSAMRDGTVDLEVGILDHLDPETRTEPLVDTELVGVVRDGHPFAADPPDPRRYAAADHIGVSRRGRIAGPIDDRLRELGLQRRVPVTVPGYAAALFMVRDTDLVALGPAGLGGRAPQLLGLSTFPVPLDLPPVSIGMAWHPRNDRDPAHRWLRRQIHETVRELVGHQD